MNHGSLFSGIGGFDLAAEWMGWNNIFNCEWEDFPRKVLKHHFPNAKQYGDIREFDATAYAGRIDILSGGFPCQPYSVAGLRKGKEDERHLFPEMLRIIRECSPRWVVGENVRGICSWSSGLVFEEVCADLEACGYSVQPFILPAAAVNAPHRRDRVWIVAHANNKGRSNGYGEIQGTNGEVQQRNDCSEFSDTNSRNAPDTENGGRRGGSGEEREERRERMVSGECEGRTMGSEIEGCSRIRNAPDTYHAGLQRSKITRSTGQGGKERDEQPTRFVRKSWENFPTVPPVCGGDDGLPKELDGITFSKWRKESIKAYGNAIVPQVALQIFQAIQQYENMNT
jgi:DNA (cytosine-5)-methyltransferase 1